MNRLTQKESARWLAEFLRQYRKGERAIEICKLTPTEILGLTGGVKIEKKDDNEND